MDNCIFCNILKDKTDRERFIYEDDLLYVIPTLGPVNIGHVLVITKEHIERFEDLDGEVAAHVFRITNKISRALKNSKFSGDGMNIFVANGEAAGQEIFHFHLHIYPRFKNDEFGFKYNDKHFVKQNIMQMQETANEIKKYLSD